MKAKTMKFSGLSFCKENKLLKINKVDIPNNPWCIVHRHPKLQFPNMNFQIINLIYLLTNIGVPPKLKITIFDQVDNKIQRKYQLGKAKPTHKINSKRPKISIIVRRTVQAFNN